MIKAISLLTVVMFLGILFIHWKLDDIKIELKYRNTLQKENNKILKDKL
jgi:hypothetical protein